MDCIFSRLDEIIEQIVVSQEIDGNPELSIAAHGAESNLSLSIRHLFIVEPSCLTTIHESSSQELSNWLCTKLLKDITNPRLSILC